jgi:hypothetical protein
MVEMGCEMWVNTLSHPTSHISHLL